MIPSRRAFWALVTALLVLLPPPASAAPRADADHFEAYFPSADGRTVLHADVLRPAGIGSRTRTPVLMTVGPYFNQGDGIRPFDEPPSDRFYDFLDLTRVLDKGYTYVMVDLPGFGGSSGCNDWGGFREQGAVKAAVEWAARQPWSSGRVGLIGKSYDAWTGLMGIAHQPKGLAAVVAMEPVYSGYRYLYTDGVRYPNFLGTPLVFQAFDARPGAVSSTPRYQLNGAPQAWCYGINVTLQQQDQPGAPFWMERDLLPPASGKRTPLFLTQGLLETNTKSDAAFAFFEGMRGPKRAWFGQFDHVRGWEKAGKRFETGRSSFAAELMRFLDRYVKAVPREHAPVHRDPVVAVQDAAGRYRAEPSWPPPDAKTWWTSLRSGAYADDGSNVGTGPGGGNGVWSVSQSLPHDAWLAGEPALRARVDTVVPGANLVVNLYDIAPGGRATLISRGASLLRRAGRQHVQVDLYGQDWPVRRGHRLGVLVSGANADWWAHLPTSTEVTVHSASIGLPFLTSARRSFIEGTPTPRLEEHKRSAFVTLGRRAIVSSTRRFSLPPRLD